MRQIFAIVIACICFSISSHASQINLGGSGGGGGVDIPTGDGEWLRLDTTNDPLTGSLEISGANNFTLNTGIMEMVAVDSNNKVNFKTSVDTGTAVLEMTHTKAGVESNPFFQFSDPAGVPRIDKDVFTEATVTTRDGGELNRLIENFGTLDNSRTAVILRTHALGGNASAYFRGTLEQYTPAADRHVSWGHHRLYPNQFVVSTTNTLNAAGRHVLRCGTPTEDCWLPAGGLKIASQYQATGNALEIDSGNINVASGTITASGSITSTGGNMSAQGATFNDGGTFTVVKSAKTTGPEGEAILVVENTDTGSADNAKLQANTLSTSGDPILSLNVSGVNEATISVDNDDSDNLEFVHSGNEFMSVTTAGSVTLDMGPAGNMTWSTDGGGDIGAVGASRPDTIYAKTDVVIGDTMTLTDGQVKQNDDGVADAVAADDLAIVAANKTAGTGDGGNVTLTPGTSAGGAPGKVRVNGSLEATGDIGFHGEAPVSQGASIATVTGGTTVDVEARTAINELLAHLRLRGDIAAPPPPPPFANNQSLGPDGTDEYALISDDNAFTNNAFTTCAWVRASSQSTTILSHWDTSTTNRAWNMNTNSGKLRCLVDQTGDLGTAFKNYESATTILDGTWHHACCAFDAVANSMNLYVDGALETPTINQDDNLASVFNPTTDVLIAAQNAGATSHFIGKLDEIAYFNTQLSGFQISEVYNSGSPPDLSLTTAAANLAAWWRFEGATITSLADSSGNGYTAVGTNMEAADLDADAP